MAQDHHPRVVWPNGAQCAVMLSFDFDAETMWLSRDPLNARRPALTSHGTYGAKVGVPKILETLRDYDVPATFFVPGWTADNHPDKTEAILRAGHEIGHHGYHHTWPEIDKPEAEEAEIVEGLEALKRVVGVVPKGYRCPAGETTDRLLPLLVKYGFLYDSSFMDDTFPYRHRLADGRPGPVELPWHWSLDDVPYMVYSLRNPRPMQTNEHILSIWKAEFQEIYRWGGLFDLINHPQAIGRPSRIALLREFIEFLRGFPNVWFATGTQIAEAWLAQDQSRRAAE